MKLKKLSIAAISFLAISISSTIFAAEDSNEVNDFFKSFNNEEKQISDDPFDSLEKELQSLENSIKQEDSSSVLVNAVETEVDIEKDKVTEEMKNQASQDVIFLRNIPEGTKITITKEFIILPQNKFIIFHEGKRTIENPLAKNPVNTFCYLELKPSGKARVIKEGKELLVTKNITEVMTLQNKDDDSEKNKLKTYETRLSVDNKSIKWITCYSAINLKDSATAKPLNVKDLRYHSDGAFKLEFPAYEEI